MCARWTHVRVRECFKHQMQVASGAALLCMTGVRNSTAAYHSAPARVPCNSVGRCVTEWGSDCASPKSASLARPVPVSSTFCGERGAECFRKSICWCHAGSEPLPHPHRALDVQVEDTTRVEEGKPLSHVQRVLPPTAGARHRVRHSSVRLAWRASPPSSPAAPQHT